MKRLDLQFFLFFAFLAVVILIVHHQSQRKLLELASAARPVQLNQTIFALCIAPSTTNIEKVEGTGHTIGNENNVQNDVA